MARAILRRQKTAEVPKAVISAEGSIRKEKIVCLLDNTERTILGRYIEQKYGLSPAQYRRHCGLPDDYPMTAYGYYMDKVNYAKLKRSIDPAQKWPEPVRPIEGSVTDKMIFCLLDGEGKTSLLGHLYEKYGMTWDEYRKHCRLPENYPCVAPYYTGDRSYLESLKQS